MAILAKSIGLRCRRMSVLEISRPDARRAALRGLIDYAGLFPPASLDMEGAVAGYRSARSSSDSWVVDRFICPAARLEELVGVLAPTMTRGEEPWSLAVTASPGWTDSLTADAGSVRMFSDTVGSAASIELVEIRVPLEVAEEPRLLTADATDVLRAFDAVVLFEIPWDIEPGAAFDAIAGVREDVSRTVGVKIRCGGLEASLFPDPSAVARFIAAAAARDLPIKATAGLHHPFRHIAPDTGFSHHGFVNILTAAALASAGEGVATLVKVLSDEDPGSFSIGRGGVTWREHTVGAEALAGTRSKLFLGYGSCSFDEPVRDLAELGALPV
jgi:hypothetical protein